MRVIAIVPTYRNIRALPEVLSGLEAGGLPVLVIDDGSDDGTGPWLDGWIAAGGHRWLERFSENRGKGAALAVGLARARALGFDFALSVDSDGQHLVSDALRIAAAMEPGVLMLGAREEIVEGYPPKSMFGRRLWALGVRSLTGLGVADPICGLRGYPLRETEGLHVIAGRYAWEEEFLVRAAWAGVDVREATIHAVYQHAGERVTHFALSDWFDSLFVWARLAALRLFGLCPRYTPRGSLARRDRSWRRILGCAVFVSFLVGVAMPSYASIPLVVWIAWRLHAPIVVAALVALGAGLVAGAFAGWTVAVSSVIPAVIVAVILAVILAVIFAALAPRTARFLGSS